LTHPSDKSYQDKPLHDDFFDNVIFHWKYPHGLSLMTDKNRYQYSYCIRAVMLSSSTPCVNDAFQAPTSFHRHHPYGMINNQHIIT